MVGQNIAKGIRKIKRQRERERIGMVGFTGRENDNAGHVLKRHLDESFFRPELAPGSFTSSS